MIFWPFAKSKPEGQRTCTTSAHLYAAALGPGAKASFAPALGTQLRYVIASLYCQPSRLRHTVPHRIFSSLLNLMRRLQASTCVTQLRYALCTVRCAKCALTAAAVCKRAILHLRPDALSLNSTALLDLHLDASQTLPSVMPIAAPAAARPTRDRPLRLQLQKSPSLQVWRTCIPTTIRRSRRPRCSQPQSRSTSPAVTTTDSSCPGHLPPFPPLSRLG